MIPVHRNVRFISEFRLVSWNRGGFFINSLLSPSVGEVVNRLVLLIFLKWVWSFYSSINIFRKKGLQGWERSQARVCLRVYQQALSQFLIMPNRRGATTCCCLRAWQQALSEVLTMPSQWRVITRYQWIRMQPECWEEGV